MTDIFTVAELLEFIKDLPPETPVKDGGEYSRPFGTVEIWEGKLYIGK